MHCGTGFLAGVFDASPEKSSDTGWKACATKVNPAGLEYRIDLRPIKSCMPTQFEIRNCLDADCDEVLELWKNADAVPTVTDTIAELKRTLAEGIAMVMVAVDTNNRIVGSVIGGWDGWRGNIYRLAVAPEARRIGLAGILVKEVSTRLARERGACRITALVERAHPDAVGFWDSMTAEGYAYDPRIARYVKTV